MNEAARTIDDDDEILRIPADDNDPEKPPTPEERIAEFLGEATGSDDVECLIYEVNARKPKEISFLFAFPLSSAAAPSKLFADVLDEYGPGYYELQSHEQGRIKVRRRFRIGSELQRRKKQADSLVPKRPKTDDDPGRELSPALAAILENQNRLIEKIADSQSSRPSTFENLEQLLSLKKFFEAEKPTGDVLGMVRDIIALKNELADSEGGDASPMTAALKLLAPSLKGLLEKAAEQQAGQSQTAAPAAKAEPNPDAPAPGGDMLNVNSIFSQLQILAEANMTPELTAQTIFEWLADQPQWVEQAALGMIAEEKERVVNRIVGSAPALAAHREWLNETVTHILAAMEADEGGDDETSGAPPDESTSASQS